MGAFVFEGALCLLLNRPFGRRGERNPEVAVDRSGCPIWVADEVGVEDSEVVFGAGGDVIFFQMKKPGGSELGVFEGFATFFADRRIDPVPDSIKNTDVRGDRFYRVTQNIDDAGVWEFCLEALDRTRKLGGFGEKNLFRPVEVEVSLKAGAVVAH